MNDKIPEDELPEDVSRWPSSPWRILGVDPSMTQREIRAAYAKRVRRFKPEHHPEQYRRIREAFDRLRTRRDATAFMDHSLHDADGSVAGSENAAGSNPFPSSRHRDPDASHRRSGAVPGRADRADQVDSFDMIWQEACDGSPEQSYEKLKAFSQQNIAGPEVFAGLYWLLRMNPTLDRLHAPMQWIETAIARHGPHPLLSELMIREVATGASVDVIGCLTPLLATDPWRSFRLLQSWFESRANLGQWNEMRSQFANLRTLLLDGHTEDWFRLQMAIIGLVGGEHDGTAQKLHQMSKDEIAAMTHLHFEFEAQLMWFDEYPAISAVLKQMGVVVGQRWERLIQEAVHSGWRQQSIIHRGQPLPKGLESLAVVVLSDALKALRKFDGLASYPVRVGLNERKGSVVLAYLNHLFGTRDFTEQDEPLKSQANRVEAFFDRFGPANYWSLRRELLMFCINEFVGPSEILWTLHRRRLLDYDGTDTRVSESLAGDTSLQLVAAIHEWCG